MPNMFGGNQTHPAYMVREMEANEALIGNWWYRIRISRKGIVSVEREHLEGDTEGVSPKSYPAEVQNKIEVLLEERQKRIAQRKKR